jgi:hypothetical protein
MSFVLCIPQTSAIPSCLQQEIVPVISARALSVRYPYCLFPDEEGSFESPLTAASILPCLPFNQDLNRFTLVVKGAKEGKYKVTWGTESLTFSAEELAKGVNLADAFVMKNLFHGPFKELQQRLTMRDIAFSKLKRAFEAWDKKSPKSADHLLLEKRLEEAEKVLHAPVEAVKHRIKIEPVSG